MTTEELGDVFEDSTETKEVTEVTEDKAEEAEPEKPEEETEVEEEAKGEEEAEPPADENEEDEKVVPVAALQSERQRRQAAEERLAKYEAQSAPDKTEDPEGYARHMRMEVSRDIMRETHDDYDDMIAHYTEMEKANPALGQIVAESKNPAKLAYDMAKEEKEIAKLQELSKSDDWKEFQKWKKEQSKVKSEVPDRTKAALSAPNLNKATSLKSTVSTPAGNTIDDIFQGSAL